MATIEFTAYPRTTEGRGASRRMRRAGKAPGIVYGGAETPAPIELDHNALVHALKIEAFHASILSMKLDGATQKVLLRDVQMHPFRPQVLHIDFQRVDENKKIHMKVPLHFVNGELSPAIKVGGAIISHVATEVDVACLPKDLPEFVEVDLSSLEANHSIRVSGLQLPPGVTAVRHGTLDPVVANAIIPKGPTEAEEEEAAAAAAAAAVPAGEVPTTAQAAPEAKAAEAPTDKKEKGGKDKDKDKDDKKK